MAEKYDRIGNKYNKTRQADRLLVDKLVHFLKPNQNATYLDIGCGTGNYTIALSQKGFNFLGIDPSINMLEKAKARESNVKWKVGKSNDLSFENEFFDGILVTLSIHHWDDLNKCFSEINRVLKIGGRFVIFTSTSEQMEGYWLNHYFPKMLEDSTKHMPKFEIIKNYLTKNKLEIVKTEKYFVHKELEDKFLYSGKHDPKIYFDESIRNGISSFSDLANASEVKRGLIKLENDIETGFIEKVINEYKNEMGDYLFIVAEKPQN